LDLHLLELLNRPTWPQEYELFTGLVGIGLYGLNRYQRQSGQQIVQGVLHQLNQKSTTTAQGIAWNNPKHSRYFREDFGENQFDLSTAHGNGSVLAFLTACVEQQVELNQAKTMLAAHCQWLVLQQNIKQSGSHFPSMSGMENRSILGWCYGDLSLSLTLIRASKVLKDSQLHDQAIAIALSTLTRTIESEKNTPIALCHGAFGHALLYHILYLHTQVEAFENQSMYWLKYGLLAIETQDLNNIPIGLISGLSGIALITIALQVQQKPLWLKLILVD
ncbi:MAG: hypothetical protein HRT35_38070, partial [Algicola sp.]|nr:hypothetical protein [Algicola sp.]